MYTNGKEEHCNKYFECRKEASKRDSRLSNRDIAADLLGISPANLTKHERGITKTVPVDTVATMAEIYHTPELKNWYCRTQCSIGKDLPLAVECGDIESIVIKLLTILGPDDLSRMKRNMLLIAEDGKVTSDEFPLLKKIIESLTQLSVISSELRTYAAKNGGC